MDEAKEYEGMENYMETRNYDFSIIDITPSKQLSLHYNFPIMGDSTSTSPILKVHSPTYNFDNRFIFSIYNRMLHYKQAVMEDYSSIYKWKEKCELKEKDILECMKEISVLQSTIVRLTQQSKKEINNKDQIIDELGNEVSRFREEYLREIDALSEKFHEIKATSDT